MKYFLFYLIIFNIITFVIYGIDKLLAILKKNRISETTLFLCSFIGGGLGAILGMFLFRHKTRKIKFYICNIFMISVWSYVIYNFLF